MSLPPDPYKPPAASLDAPVAHDSAAAVPPSVVAVLGQTRPWVKLIAVLFFLALGFAVTALMWVGTTPLRSGRPSAGFLPFLPVMLLLVFCVPPVLFLWQYAGRIRRLQDGGGLPALEEALASQKSFWKYMGILAAVILGLYALIFLFLTVGLSGGLGLG